jgi:UDP-MurNAc hydroxylase
MVKDLKSFGFTNIEELPHGKTITLQGSTSVTSYQFGLALDSAIVISGGETTLLDANDCKIAGGPLEQLCKRHQGIDFVFRSHSSASPYPICVRSYDPNHLKSRENEDYSVEFLSFAKRVKARYAIPFASNHCFLHKETKAFNNTIVSPLDVKAYFDTHNSGQSQCVAMIPGDSWSSSNGFMLKQQDYFTNRDYHIQRLEAKYAKKLQDFYATEDAVQPQWRHFERYFTGMLKALPWVLKLIFPARVLFKVKSDPEVHWLLDFKSRRVQQVDNDQVRCHFIIEVHPAVLNDCVRKRMFSVFMASKRVRIDIKEGPVWYMFLYCLLLDMYESDYFPLSSMLSKRFISCGVRRWRELLLYLGSMLGMLGKLLIKKPLSLSDMYQKKLE